MADKTLLPSAAVRSQVRLVAPDPAWLGVTCRELSPPRTAAERWAHFVLRGCEADRDLSTIAQWAKFISVSEGTLIAACRIIHIAPRDARDLMRLLRALRRCSGRLTYLAAELSISDPRTYKALLRRACITDDNQPLTFDRFIEIQGFVPRIHPAVTFLRSSADCSGTALFTVNSVAISADL